MICYIKIQFYNYIKSKLYNQLIFIYYNNKQVKILNYYNIILFLFKKKFSKIL